MVTITMKPMDGIITWLNYLVMLFPCPITGWEQNSWHYPEKVHHTHLRHFSRFITTTSSLWLIYSHWTIILPQVYYTTWKSMYIIFFSSPLKECNLSFTDWFWTLPLPCTCFPNLISLLCQFNNLIQMLLHMFCKSNPRKIKSFLYARWAPIVFSAGATPFTPFTPWQLHCQWPSLIGYYLLSYFNSMIPCVVKCLWVWVL